MKTLVAEDDFVSRVIIKELLTPYGGCDLTENGVDAVEAYKIAYDLGHPYDLVCLDIMMPKMSGQTALEHIRQFEADRGVPSEKATKIIMTTTLGDNATINKSFSQECNGYLVKPLNSERIFGLFKELGLVCSG